MSHIDRRSVYQNLSTAKSFENTAFFYSRFTGDCPICLSFHIEPRILPCGHSFCKECIDKSFTYSKGCPVCQKFFYTTKPVKFFFNEEIKKEILFRRIDLSMVKRAEGMSFFDFPYCVDYYLNIGENQEDQKGTPTIGIDKNTKNLEHHIEFKSFEQSLLLEINDQNGSVDNFKFSKDVQSVSLDNSYRVKKPDHKDIFYQSHDGQLYFLDNKEFKHLKNPPEFIYGKISSMRVKFVNKNKTPELMHIGHGVLITIVRLV